MSNDPFTPRQSWPEEDTPGRLHLQAEKDAADRRAETLRLMKSVPDQMAENYEAMEEDLSDLRKEVRRLKDGKS